MASKKETPSYKKWGYAGLVFLALALFAAAFVPVLTTLLMMAAMISYGTMSVKYMLFKRRSAA